MGGKGSGPLRYPFTEEDEKLFRKYFPRLGPQTMQREYYKNRSITWVKQRAADLELAYNDHYDRGYITTDDAMAYLNIGRKRLYAWSKKDLKERFGTPGFGTKNINKIYIRTRHGGGAYRYSWSEAYIEELKERTKDRDFIEERGKDSFVDTNQVAREFGFQRTLAVQALLGRKQPAGVHPGRYIKSLRVYRYFDSRREKYMFDAREVAEAAARYRKDLRAARK